MASAEGARSGRPLRNKPAPPTASEEVNCIEAAAAGPSNDAGRMQKPPVSEMYRLQVPIQAQPTDTSCGPTCLQAIYGYYGESVPLETLIDEIRSVEGGGTLAVLLGLHALRRGYEVILYTCNLQVFDPSWFHPVPQDLREKLRLQLGRREGKRLEAARAYLEFVERGGEVRFEDLTGSLIEGHLVQGTPLLTGLSATYLYRAPREVPETGEDDDIGGEPLGHFVVLHGWRPETQTVLVADPYLQNPLGEAHSYEVPITRLLNAILLGVLTYDGNLLVIRPPQRRA